MIELKRITTKDCQHYNYVENLLIASFPVEEYRDLHILKEYANTRTDFYCNIILDDSVSVGFLTYWDLEDFYYIEHFAIDPQLRNGGYGQKVLEDLDRHIRKNIVLEVERPTEEVAQRRIRFYQKLGYALWEKEYVQPPYRMGYKELPMYLMAKGDLIPDKDFERIKKLIYRKVYHVEC